jgi:hypothetical protein
MPRDQAAELLSMIRSAYKCGYMDASGLPLPPGGIEGLYAVAEARAIEYVRVREENERHPLAILVTQLSTNHPS